MNHAHHATKTLDELLDTRELLTTEHPFLFGPVHHTDGQYRWLNLPVTRPHHVTPNQLGDVLYHTLHSSPPSVLAELPHHLPNLCGWMATGTAWFIPNPLPKPDTPISEDPRREPTIITLYLDQHSGSLRHRLYRNNTLDHATTEPRPTTGWTPDQHGTIAATLDLCRNRTRT